MEKRKIIIGAFAVAALNVIFPPWQVNIKSRIIDTGYWWITNPPRYISTSGYPFGSEINATRLLVQLALVALVAGGLYFAVKEK